MNELAELIREEGKIIRIYLGKEISQDPEEENKIISYINPIPVKALVVDLISSQTIWKMYGVKTAKAKEIVLPKRWRDTIELSQKIEVEDEDYHGWRKDGKLQIREEGNYIRLYIYNT